MNPRLPYQEDEEDEPPEHRRFAARLRALDVVRDEEEFDLVASVLTDPDPAVATSAIVRHLDRRAASLLEGPEWTAWAAALAEVVGARPFLAQRLAE
ncbi:hypothetical protein [Actinacidiphila yeochonensis]|uniref:hypothetical protein n=1 Tax=Actinacidiphila yeochonensis TaxID=89050 RepID=UPI00069123AF|nr:hypothetical protein [Actinacidiphila yeochonensis]